MIPVLSTRTLFALEAKPADDRTRVIIVDLGGAKTGLVVDSVKEVVSIAQSNIAPPPPSISSGADAQFISGIGKVENGKRMIVLLDVGRVLTRVEKSELVALNRPDVVAVTVQGRSAIRRRCRSCDTEPTRRHNCWSRDSPSQRRKNSRIGGPSR